MSGTCLRAAEARRVAGESLYGGPGRPLHEAVNSKPVFHWSLQDVGCARAVRYLPKKTADREWNQAKGEQTVAGSRARRAGPSKCFDMRRGVTRFAFLPCWVSVFFYTNISLLWPGSSLLEWQYIFCAIACCKYGISFLVLQDVTVKTLP
jgi:hypothetical protein